MTNTPEQLMRSRYNAFLKKDWQYIADTSLYQSIEELSDSVSISWLKLDVLKAYDNIVEFKAYYKVNETVEVLHEKSTFVQVNGTWKYQDGELYPSKILSNEKCPCGSSKKFKKCCASKSP